MSPPGAAPASRAARLGLGLLGAVLGVLTLGRLPRLAAAVEATVREVASDAAELGLALPVGSDPLLAASTLVDTVGRLGVAVLVVALARVADRVPGAGWLGLFLLTLFLDAETLLAFFPDPGGWVGVVDRVIPVVGGAALLRTAATFPRTLGPSDLAVEGAAGSPGRGPAGLLLRAVRPITDGRLVLAVAALLAAVAAWGELAGRDLVALAPAWIALAGGGAAALPLLTVGFRGGSLQERRRLLWALTLPPVLFVVLALVGLPVTVWAALRFDLYLAPVTFIPLTSAFTLGTVVLMALAVFRDAAVDPSLVLRKGTVWGGFGTALLFVFGVTEAALTEWVAAGLGAPDGLGAAVAAGLLVSVFRPAQRRVQDRMDRFVEDRLPPTVLAEAPSVRATIVFSDVVGYTRLTTEDPEGALTVLSVFHRAAHRTANARRGRVVKTIGDAVLLEFRTADEAVRGALDLRATHATAGGVLDLPSVDLRTGIDAGEIVRDREGDVFGHTVNLAARLQTGAEPDQVLVTEAAREEALPDLDAAVVWTPVGERTFKNVDAPVRCWAVAPRGDASTLG